MTETFEINIVLDNSLKATITLKKEMTALEFMGITHKAKALFNISNKELVTLVSEEVREKKKINKSNRANWPEDKIKLLKEKFSFTPTKALAAMPEFANYTYQQIDSKAYLMGLKKTASSYSKGKFSEDQVNTIINLSRRGEHFNFIAERLSMTEPKQRISVRDKIYALKKAGRL
jgi:hypothetical protein